MPKRLSNEEKLKRIDEHNTRVERRISRENQKELVEITNKFIKYCKKINNKYTKKDNLITK